MQNHKIVHVLDKLPVRERPEYVSRSRAVWRAHSVGVVWRSAEKLAGHLHAVGYERAAT